MEDDLHVCPETLPPPAYPLQRVKTVKDAEADIVSLALTVGAEVKQQHLVSLLMEELRVGRIVRRVACKAVMEDYQLF